MRYALVAVVAAILAAPHVAAADDKAECSFFEIKASKGKQPSVDPELKVLEKKLIKPPFASWNEFHKLSGGPVALTKQKAATLKLAQGAAQILLRDRNEKRLEITVNLDAADGTRVLDNKQSVAVGDWSAWGHNVKDDGHILALTCK